MSYRTTHGSVMYRDGDQFETYTCIDVFSPTAVVSATSVDFPFSKYNGSENITGFVLYFRPLLFATTPGASPTFSFGFATDAAATFSVAGGAYSGIADAWYTSSTVGRISTAGNTALTPDTMATMGWLSSTATGVNVGIGGQIDIDINGSAHWSFIGRSATGNNISLRGDGRFAVSPKIFGVRVTFPYSIATSTIVELWARRVPPNFLV